MTSSTKATTSQETPPWTPAVMLLPTLECDARCSYCFGPRDDGPPIDKPTLARTADWLETLPGSDVAQVTLHGGEPLCAGRATIARIFGTLEDVFRRRGVSFALQSNLWALDDHWCSLLYAHRVRVGTSLDGPQPITDRQRGRGYFARTFSAVERLRRHGISAAAICTLTRASCAHTERIFQFFETARLPFAFHFAVGSLHAGSGHMIPSTQEASDAFAALLRMYAEARSSIRISTIDAMARSLASGLGATCTFRRCLGEFVAIAPDGGLYPCQRFVGHEIFRIGHVADRPSLDDLRGSPAWQTLSSWQQHVEEHCLGCPFWDICYGGCPYDAFATAGGDARRVERDPACSVYRSMFSQLSRHATKSVFKSDNLAAVIAKPDPARPLLRHGFMMEIMNGGVHPADRVEIAQTVLCAAYLGTAADSETAWRRLRADLKTVATDGVRTELRTLHEALHASVLPWNNLYAVITNRCEGRCRHCFGGLPGQADDMSSELLATVFDEAARLGFRKLVVTGGEPLAHAALEDLLRVLAAGRSDRKRFICVLRTSLPVAGDTSLRRALAATFDQIVISLDGDRESHDARRGDGSYDRTIANVRKLSKYVGGHRITLSASLYPSDVDSDQAQRVRNLGRSLRLGGVRIRPLLPLGRARADYPDRCRELAGVPNSVDGALRAGWRPRRSCGLDQNLSVAPDGTVFACHAWREAVGPLGRLGAGGTLASVVGGSKLCALGSISVDANPWCATCVLRYVCGGMCRAWDTEPKRVAPDDPPEACVSHRWRARALLVDALEVLGVDTEVAQRWIRTEV